MPINLSIGTMENSWKLREYGEFLTRRDGRYLDGVDITQRWEAISTRQLDSCCIVGLEYCNWQKVAEIEMVKIDLSMVR